MKKLLWMNYIWAAFLATSVIYSFIKQGYIISPYASASETTAFMVGSFLGQLIPIFVLIISALAIKGVAGISFKFAIIMNNVLVFFILLNLVSSGKFAMQAYIVLALTYLPFLINIFGLAKKKRISS